VGDGHPRGVDRVEHRATRTFGTADPQIVDSCSSTRLGLNAYLLALAEVVADEVHSPPPAGVAHSRAIVDYCTPR